MERKIGEIFEYNGSWFQCCKREFGCMKCYFNGHGVEGCGSDEVGSCTSSHRSDGKDVIFKKLEKVGEPYEHYEKLYQCYKLPMKTEIILLPDNCYPIGKDNLVEIEIKENKEDMEEEKHSNLENTGKNLKPFDLQKAKAGKPVCTRDGRKARIICFDYAGETGDYPIVALVSYNKGNNRYERVLKYTSDGLFNKYGDCKHDEDLMMLPEKKEGWINVKKDASLFKSREEAERNCTKDYATVRVEFEI